MSNLPPSHDTQTAWLSFQLHHAFAGFHLDAQVALHHPWTILFGPSGSGKTTILRTIAGLFTPDSGQISLQHETIFARLKNSPCTANVPPLRRRIGLVTQAPALFPHYTAAQNVGFSLRRLSATERNRKVQALLQIFHVEGLHDHFPSQLSGGQQQRIALARTLAAEPRLLLLDEPFSALDRTSRQEALSGLRQWLQQREVPVLMVTHDLAEAFSASDEVVVLESGSVIAQGKADEVLHIQRAQLLKELGVPSGP
ncbi:MAG TPA: ATP-binding cassette domain-containing protein [Acidobacteriaceae bacterium]|nr:ATP-binding cassette domain-containing protein [Acidobacteriaceae bacterium]